MLIVGIDLGTTHSALAFINPDEGSNARVHDFPVPQLTRPGEVGSPRLLPSCVYLPSAHEPLASALPWGTPDSIVGELARWQGARVPGRLVASAKSWLCHAGVDRQAAILPWGAPADVSKLSPVDASSRILTHLADAFDHAHPETPLREQEVVVTVPASFDEAARALTVQAAQQSGFRRFKLLEEPQAAFYAFTASRRAELSRALQGMRLVLVVDVGGGTTDFTLVWVEAQPEGPAMKRIAVGDHLMLGGDNMDAALAHSLEERLVAGGRKLQASQWTQLLLSARAAKEALLSEPSPDRFTVAVAGAGSKLIGGTASVEVSREEVQALLVDGFFPRVAATDSPRRSARLAIQELGLPYAQDAGITRHLVEFLRRHAEAGFVALGEQGAAGSLPRPDAVLLNGGVFNSPVLSARLVDALSALWPSRERIRLLEHDSLDLAVARGAAYYGLVRRGLGRRIGGGAARAYYVRVDTAEQSRLLCLVPRGFEEGETVDVGAMRFQLALGKPVEFQLYSTTSDRVDKTGDLVELDEQQFQPLPPIHTLLRAQDAKRPEASVHLRATLTEIGTLELFCVSDESDERWRLEFSVRGTGAAAPLVITESMPSRFAEATELIQRIYGHKPLPVGSKDVKQLVKALEKSLGPKETWRLPVLRELWSALFAGANKRRRSPDHERVFFHLLGYTLRPGFGYPLDEWRAEQSFSVFQPLVSAHQEKPVWIEFWVMWRRVAGGLSESAQQALFTYLMPHLERRVPVSPAKHKDKLKGVIPEGLDEMVRTAAALEHVDPQDKERLGEWVLERIKDPATVGGPWSWALGRLGARMPLYGSGHRTVPPDVASRWLSALLERGLAKVDGAPFAAVQLARRTGDRTRDLDDELRIACLRELEAAKVPAGWLELVREVARLEAADEARAFGDTLPAGLRLG